MTQNQPTYWHPFMHRSEYCAACDALHVPPRRRTSSFVSFTETTPNDLDGPAEGIQSRSIILTPAKKNNQALATGHDQRTSQFAFFHRKRSIFGVYQLTL
ncbi:hypothetical protein [Paraburkholderia phytofirmans]|uniref:hypothetical protein n=1 Tax=Paraburkholderia phytofirmans TaxID=261302 RepID=UPI0013144B6E|nr:hypothetical protein [Paraburkholderia phytofirmans]